MSKLKVGIQLFSLRDKMEADMDATLKAVKEAGYDCVEFAGYFGKSAKEVKGLLDKYGLSCYSVHYNATQFLEEGQEGIDYFKELGVKYYVIPHYSIDEYINNYDETVKTFNKLAKVLNENGIELLYHNHDFEFVKIDGEYLIDKLYKDVPAMNPEFDVCWVRYGGEDPCKYLKKYEGKIKIVHYKDFECKKIGGGPVYELIGVTDRRQEREDNGFKFRPVGSGMQNWDDIIATTREIGAEVVIVEQDQWYDDDNIDCAKSSREFLKSKGV